MSGDAEQYDEEMVSTCTPPFPAAAAAAPSPVHARTLVVEPDPVAAFFGAAGFAAPGVLAGADSNKVDRHEGPTEVSLLVLTERELLLLRSKT